MLVLEMIEPSEDVRKERLEELLEEFSIQHLRKSKAYTLSGGERRRVEIARCLVPNPNFILLDEPFAGIDPIAVEDIQKIIEKLKKKNIGIFITDHNVRETLTITDRSYLLYNGKILKSGSTKDLTEDEEAKKLYLGTKFKMDI
jgi:lipopolysaccharide export system ATP-binding protein